VADFPLADRRKLFADNAARFYRIDVAKVAAPDQPTFKGKPSRAQ
jgi:hypothetical protein